jgi:hypothetical protein
MHVSRLLTRILAFLREGMEGDVEEDAAARR